jgi:hypothetical protein
MPGAPFKRSLSGRPVAEAVFRKERHVLSLSMNDGVSFHEASLLEAQNLPDGSLRLSFEGVHLQDHLCEASINLKGVGRILRAACT